MVRRTLLRTDKRGALRQPRLRLAERAEHVDERLVIRELGSGEPGPVHTVVERRVDILAKRVDLAGEVDGVARLNESLMIPSARDTL